MPSAGPQERSVRDIMEVESHRVFSFARAGAATALVLGALLADSPASADEPPTKEACIAANESAQDLQTAGKLRDARSKLLVCVAESCPGPLRQDCTQRLADVDKAAPTVVFVAKDSAGSDLSAVRVTMDGHVLVDSLNGTAIPVDPGEHRFFFEAAGLPLLDKTLVLKAGEKDWREFVVFGGAALPGGAPPAAAAPPAGLPAQPAAPSPPPESASPGGTGSTGSSQRMIGLVLGGAGAVGLVVGGVFGILTKTTYDHALGSECGLAAGYADAKTCTAAGAQDVQSSHDLATISTIGFIGGAALLGGGAYLFFTAPKANAVSVAPAVGTSSAGLSVRGSF